MFVSRISTLFGGEGGWYSCCLLFSGRGECVLPSVAFHSDEKDVL